MSSYKIKGIWIMHKFFQIILVFAVLLLAIGTIFLILDIVSLGEFQETIQKMLLVLAVFTGAGIALSFLIRPKQS